MCYQLRWFIFLCMSVCQTNKSQIQNQLSKVSTDIVISKNSKPLWCLSNIHTRMNFWKKKDKSAELSLKSLFWFNCAWTTPSELNQTIHIDIFDLMILFCRFGSKIVVLNFDIIPCLSFSLTYWIYLRFLFLFSDI